MNIREDLLRGIYAYGFEKPSAIQQRAIVPCCKGNKKDLIPKLVLGRKICRPFFQYTVIEHTQHCMEADPINTFFW